jgi:hypothetical protein
VNPLSLPSAYCVQRIGHTPLAPATDIQKTTIENRAGKDSPIKVEAV